MSDKNLSNFAEELLSIIPHLMRSAISKQGNALGTGKITVPQYILLDLLSASKELKMKNIAKELAISLPAATGLVNRLHKAELIKRGYDMKDRRAIYISLTPKGAKMIQEIKLERKKIIQDTFGKLTEKERHAYINILRKLQYAFKDRRP